MFKFSVAQMPRNEEKQKPFSISFGKRYTIFIVNCFVLKNTKKKATTEEKQFVQIDPLNYNSPCVV